MCKNDVVIKAQLPIPAKGIAHRLGRCAQPESIFRLLCENPRQVEDNVRTVVEAVIHIAEAKISIESFRFSHVDSNSIVDAKVYFTAIIRGTKEELHKVFSEDRMNYAA